MKKTLLTIIIVILVISVTLGAVSCKDKTTNDGKFNGTDSYTTETIKFWVGVGKAYMTFDNNEFNVYVSVSDGEFESWLKGTYAYDSSKYELTLTATWEDNGDETTKLSNAENGKPFTYTFEDGVCKIKVDIPSAGSKTFEIIA